MSLQANVDAISLAAIHGAGPASQILIRSIGGHPFLVSQGVGPPKLLWIEKLADESEREIGQSLLIAAVQAAWPGYLIAAPQSVRPESLYSLAESMPPEAVKIQVGSPNSEEVYVDPITGRILTVMDQSRRAYAWVFYALHTFKFPALSNRPTLRHITVLVPLGAGFLFCLTAVVIGVSRLRSTLH